MRHRLVWQRQFLQASHQGTAYAMKPRYRRRKNWSPTILQQLRFSSWFGQELPAVAGERAVRDPAGEAGRWCASVSNRIDGCGDSLDQIARRAGVVSLTAWSRSFRIQRNRSHTVLIGVETVRRNTAPQADEQRLKSGIATSGPPLDSHKSRHRPTGSVATLRRDDPLIGFPASRMMVSTRAPAVTINRAGAREIRRVYSVGDLAGRQ